MVGKSPTISVKVLADTRKFQRAMKDLGDTTGFNKVSQGFKNVAKAAGVASVALAGAAAAGLGKAVTLASDLQQSMGAVESVFGKGADQVKKFSKEAAVNLGLSQDAYNKTAALLGASLKNAGVSADQLGTKTQEFIKMGADLSATFGGTTQEAADAMTAAFRGEYDQLEKYGIKLSESMVKQEMETKGLTRAQAVQNLVMSQGASAVGAFERESDTLAQKQQVLKAKMENIGATIGGYLLPALTKVAGWLADHLEPAFERVSDWVKTTGVPAFMRLKDAFERDVMPHVRNLAETVQTKVLPALRTFVDRVVDLGKWLKDNATWIGPIVAGVLAMVVAFQAYVKVMAIWKAAVAAAKAAQIAFNAVLAMNPIGLVVLAIVGLVTAIVLLYQKNETFRKIVQAVWAAVKSAIKAVGDWFTGTLWPALRGAINAVRGGFVSMKDRVLGAWDTLKAGLRAVGTWINDKVFSPLKTAVNSVKTTFERVKDGISTVWNKLRSVAAKPVNFVIDTVYNNGIRSWWNNISSKLGLGKTLPKAQTVAFANGTEDHRAQIAKPGDWRVWAEPETGGEAYIPLAKSKRGRSTAILAEVARRFGYNLSAYADGGFWGTLKGIGGDIFDKVKDLGKGMANFVKDPMGTITNAANNLLGGWLKGAGSGSFFWDFVRDVPKKIISGLGNAARSLFDGVEEPGKGVGGKGMGYKAMISAAKSLIPGVRITSSLRPGARTAGAGVVSMHALGRAIDLVGGPGLGRIWDILNSAYGMRSSELLYSPKGSQQIRRGGFRGDTSGITKRMHYNHVHWAMADGGIFDQGGWLKPGALAMNLTNKPEAVLTPDQSKALTEMLDRRVNVNARPKVRADIDFDPVQIQQAADRARARVRLQPLPMDGVVQMKYDRVR